MTHATSGPGGREHEVKLALDGDAALAALRRAAEARGARAEEPVRQTNHLFDTADGRLRRGGVALRLREEAGRATLTGKGPSEGDDLVHAREEVEAVVPAPLAAAILRGSRSALDVLVELRGDAALVRRASALAGGAPVLELGAFANARRRVAPFRVGELELALELDRTELPGGRVDHEVELEVPPGREAEARRALLALLAEAGVAGRPARSKAARFLEALAATGGAPPEPPEAR